MARVSLLRFVPRCIGCSGRGCSRVSTVSLRPIASYTRVPCSVFSFFLFLSGSLVIVSLFVFLFASLSVCLSLSLCCLCRSVSLSLLPSYLCGDVAVHEHLHVQPLEHRRNKRPQILCLDLLCIYRLNKHKTTISQDDNI